jgi:hypothetical protein
MLSELGGPPTIPSQAFRYFVYFAFLHRRLSIREVPASLRIVLPEAHPPTGCNAGILGADALAFNAGGAHRKGLSV